MDIFAAIVTGVVIFVVGQVVQQFVLAPIKDFNKERGDTSYLLLRHQAVITNASARDAKTVDEIHEMGAALISTVTQIPFYDSISSIRLFGLPSRQSVHEAAKEVNGIVYRMQAGGNVRAEENVRSLTRIAQLLGVRTSY
jgi:hypothetical protein